jgi:hypothetical protein
MVELVYINALIPDVKIWELSEYLFIYLSVVYWLVRLHSVGWYDY